MHTLKNQLGVGRHHTNAQILRGQLKKKEDEIERLTDVVLELKEENERLMSRLNDAMKIATSSGGL